ncbi:MAG TPA: DUF6680 family protein, partial [Steroidobacteraceae bacterium]
MNLTTDPLKTSDLVIAGATLLGPILAVQAQKWVERLRQKQNRHMWIFSTECAEMSDAGNEPLAIDCHTRLVNAENYLIQHAQRSVLPPQGWIFCSQTIGTSFDMGARCITALEQRCQVTPTG